MGSVHCTSVVKSPVRRREFFYQLALVLPMKENVTREAVVVVIDDDASVRADLKELIESVGLEVRLYASADAFLEAHMPDTTSCFVLDVRLPGMSGLKVQEKLSRAGVYTPIVFVTGHEDVAMAVRAMKAGAIDFLTKPFRSQDLLDAVFAALEVDSARRKMQQLHSTIREHFESLSGREREVIARVAAGKLNKQIAAELGLSEVTVKVHRASAMRKMHATTLAHLIRMLDHVEQCNMTSRSSNSAPQLGEDLFRVHVHDSAAAAVASSET
jgi:FixJ family two-component response regulator